MREEQQQPTYLLLTTVLEKVKRDQSSIFCAQESSIKEETRFAGIKRCALSVQLCGCLGRGDLFEIARCEVTLTAICILVLRPPSGVYGSAELW